MSSLIRLERKEDYNEVENLVRESFWNVYREGALEHFVLKKMRDDLDFVKELDFVLEKDNQIIGQNVFAKAKIESDDGNIIQVLTMGPISITKSLRHKGYGKMLLDYSLEQAKALGYGAVCIEGDINFYGKSGFKYAKDYNIRYNGMSLDEDTSFFLCIELQEGYLNKIKGNYITPECYYACDKYKDEFNEYENSFVSRLHHE